MSRLFTNMLEAPLDIEVSEANKSARMPFEKKNVGRLGVLQVVMLTVLLVIGIVNLVRMNNSNGNEESETLAHVPAVCQCNCAPLQCPSSDVDRPAAEIKVCYVSHTYKNDDNSSLYL